MTKELLEQYPDIVAELEYLEAKQRTTLHDSVEASSGPPAYKKHIITISGTKTVQSDNERIKELKGQLLEIDEFMGTLPFRHRRIVEMKAMHEMTWSEIAADFQRNGYNKSQSTLAKIYSNICKSLK